VTPTGYGDSTYSIEIRPENGEHYLEGTQVIFRIDGSRADQTAVLKMGENIRIDLTARSAGTTSSSESSSAWVTAGLVLACLLELVVVGGVVYLTFTEWSR